MSDSTGDVETVQFEDLSFEDAVEFAKAAFGFPDSWARTYVCIERGLDQEGPVPADDDDEG